ncbi:MAG: caspase family protein [Bacteroidales bacterium]|nr:caspase family protein [Bacteroidales bacterium]
MNRKALLIGNSNGLSGVKKDISNWESFLTSDIGGKWFPSEIDVEMNPSKISLMSKINTLKHRYDFVLVVYSGHGAYSQGTILEINSNEEYVFESDLKGIAPRQISVFDCCRGIVTMQDSIKESIKNLSVKNQFTSNIRQDYETRIMQAIPQQISLYACSIGESAYDSNDGGYYTKNLLKSTNLFVDEQRFLTVGMAHQAGALRTTSEVFEKEKVTSNYFSLTIK